MDATAWDERYRAHGLVWGGPPNRWVVEELDDAPPGRALDLACGEGRNALWLAAHGWQVTAVDFSAVAIGKARELDTNRLVEWVEADATGFAPAQPVDLALLSYLQLPADQRRRAVRGAAGALAPGGLLLVIAHDSRNLADGTGGPQDPRVLYSAPDVVADLEGTGVVIGRAEEVLRPVAGTARPAIDVLVRGRAGASPGASS
ncbi:MAG TPA: methyltransferase domain-containing protein [Jatrophihabitans sp.]|jgi:SAM-dependent methyltransferase